MALKPTPFLLAKLTGPKASKLVTFMDEQRANVEWLSLVWSIRGEERLRMEIGLDARRNSGSPHSERKEMTFFLTSPLIGLIELQTSSTLLRFAPVSPARTKPQAPRTLDCAILGVYGLAEIASFGFR